MKKLSLFIIIFAILISIILLIKFLVLDKETIIKPENDISLLVELYDTTSDNIILEKYFNYNIKKKIEKTRYNLYSQNTKDKLSNFLMDEDKSNYRQFKNDISIGNLFYLSELYKNDITNDKININFKFKDDLPVNEKIFIHNKINKSNNSIKNVIVYFIYENNIVFFILFNIIVLFLIFLFYEDIIRNRERSGNIDKIFNTILHGNFYYRIFPVLFLFLMFSGIIFISIYTIIKVYIFEIKIFVNIGAIVMLLFLSIIFRKNIKNKQKINKNDEGNFLLSDEYCSIKEGESNHKYIKILSDIINTLPNDQYFSIALNGLWGSGKTSILKTFEQDIKNNDKKLKCIWISLWEFKNSEDVIIEIENQFKKIIYDDLITINKKHLNFFKITAGLYDAKLDSIFDFFNDAILDESKNNLQDKLSNALARKNIEKIIIIFDDLDRILEKDEVLQILKIIRYLINFKNIISITAVDLEKVVNLIKNDNSKESKYKPSYNYDFIYKIFNSVIDLSDSQNQSELVGFLRKQLSDVDSNFDKFLNKNFGSFFINYKLKQISENYGLKKVESHIHKIFKDKRDEIKKEIGSLIKGENIYGLFYNYREIILTINDFYLKLLSMKNKKSKIMITDNINLKDVFLLSALKNINIEFYHSLISDLWNKIENNEKIKIIDYLTKYKLDLEDNSDGEKITQYYAKNKKDYRLLKIFKCMGINLDKKTILGSIFNKENELKFYIYPNLEIYQISKQEIETHYKEFSRNPSIDTIQLYFNNKNTEKFENHELQSFLSEYIDKIHNLINSEKEDDVKINLFLDVTYFTLEFLKDKEIKFYSDEFKSILLKILDFSNISSEYGEDNSQLKTQVLEKIKSDNKMFEYVINFVKNSIQNYNVFLEIMNHKDSIFSYKYITTKEEYIKFMNSFFSNTDESLEYIGLYINYVNMEIRALKPERLTIEEIICKIIKKIDLININYNEYNNKDSLISHLIEIILYPFLYYSKDDKNLVFRINESKLSRLIVEVFEKDNINLYKIRSLLVYFFHSIRVSYISKKKINIEYFEQLLEIIQKKRKFFLFTEPLELFKLYSSMEEEFISQNGLTYEEKVEFLKTYKLTNKQIKTLDDTKEVFEQYKKDFP